MAKTAFPGGDARAVATGPMWVVEVADDRDPRLSGGRAHTTYTSPPQPLTQALALVAVLLGGREDPLAVSDAPWRLAIAGGRREVQLHPAHADGQLIIV
jgi:hypothetical protein